MSEYMTDLYNFKENEMNEADMLYVLQHIALFLLGFFAMSGFIAMLTKK